MSVLIKNGLIFDGSGKIPFKSDIFINHRRISRLGNFPHQSAEKIIDARGMMVTPGFVDINSDADHRLNIFCEPQQNNYLKEGITTIIGGNAGSSLAPLIDGSLISIRKWAEDFSVNVNWRTVAEFLNSLKNRKLAVNFGTLVGYSTIRRAIIGGELRDLTEKEIKIFNFVLEQGLKEGAFGLSTGLNYVHSCDISEQEIEFFVQTAVKFKKIYSTQLRSYTDSLHQAIKEVLAIAKNTGASIEINKFTPLNGFGENYLKEISNLEKEGARANIYFDVSINPFSRIEIYMFLPKWLRTGGLEAMFENIGDIQQRSRLLNALAEIEADDLFIAKVPSAVKFLTGKSLTEFSQTQNLPPAEALLKLMELTHLKAELLYKNVDLNALNQALLSEKAIISSSENVRSLNFIKENNILPLEKAIAKMTYLPAKKFNIRERGLLAEGYYADIVVFRNEKPSEVLVNGEIAMQDEKIKNVSAGEILKNKA